MRDLTNNHDSGTPSISKDRKRPRAATTRVSLLLLAFCLLPSAFCLASSALVLQSDFGLKDGAVAAMKGVAAGVDPDLKVYDLTHEIPAFNVWEGAYRLWQTAPYWPTGTVFVSVVDPGVGTNRKSVVARAKNGQYFVTPDNGTLTLVAEHFGIDAVREIDEKVNRRPGSENSYTFHGRDVYSYTGARLAAGVIKFEQVGPVLDPAKLVSIVYPRVAVAAGGREITGNIPVLDPQYGNVWTNIDAADFAKLAPKPKTGDLFKVVVSWHSAPDNKAEDLVVNRYERVMPYVNSFGDVPVGELLLYLNSLMQVSFAYNQSSMAALSKISSGPQWQVTVTPASRP